MFGQRAMKVQNMLKIMEEFDYKSLARKLDIQLDKLIAESERQQKTFMDRIEMINKEAQNRMIDTEGKYAEALEKERLKYQRDYMESVKKLEDQLAANQLKIESERKIAYHTDGTSHKPSITKVPASDHVAEIESLLQNETHLREAAQMEVENLRCQLAHSKRSEAAANSEILKLHKMLDDEAHQKEEFEREITLLQSQLLQLSFEADEVYFQHLMADATYSCCIVKLKDNLTATVVKVMVMQIILSLKLGIYKLMMEEMVIRLQWPIFLNKWAYRR